MFKKREILKYSERSGFEKEMFYFPLEDKVTIFLNNLEIISLLCSPTNLDELAVGFLTAEGFACNNNDYWEIEKKKQGQEIYVYAEEAKDLYKILLRGTLTSGCGQGQTFQSTLPKPQDSNVNVSMKHILHYARIFQNETLSENKVGGFHKAGLLIEDEFIIRQDVGRHNAVDKIGGYSRLQGIETKEAVLFLTGRVSSEIVMKGAKLKLPLIASLSGATSLAIDLAKEAGITLVGYVRGKNAAVFSHPERILP